MRRLAFLLVPVALAACARPKEFVAPAPAGAVSCAVREAEHLGYTRIAGEPGDAFVRMGIRIPPPPAQGPAAPPPLDGPSSVAPPPARGKKEIPPLQDQLLFREQDGKLHVQVVSVSSSGQSIAPSQDAVDHAQMVLARCTG
ncbi:MAG TPA: hypothetical protein VFL93_14135 [Longimicrobiaceae bacterium]|nr:hypothetical protein [Longimicrobiaceae bacterium]